MEDEISNFNSSQPLQQQSMDINVSIHLAEPQISTGLNNNDQDIELIKQINTLTNNQTTATDTQRINEDINSPHSRAMDKISPIYDESNPSRSSETSGTVHHSTLVSLKGLLSYQDVMQAIEREFHLHEGQEREIIMKLWLKGQTMISILSRFRHLLEDLNIDDRDFVQGLKQIREMIHHTNHDLEHLREHTIMLENENRFLENEFQRQLDRIIREKNEQITRLTQIIDQTCPPMKIVDDQQPHPPVNEQFYQKFLQQNVELQREIETLRAKLEYSFTLINDKFEQQKTTATSDSLIQTAFEQIRRTEMSLQELKSKSASQQQENDFLKYLIEKSQRTTTTNEQQDSFRTIEQRALERELERVRHELEITEKRTGQLEQRFEHADETVKFQIEKMKLECDVFKEHIQNCSQRLDEMNKQRQQLLEKRSKQQEESMDQKRITELESELAHARTRYNDLADHSNMVKAELNTLRLQIHEKDRSELNLNSELERARHHARQYEDELKSLRTKYDDVCERVSAATHQLERVKIVLEETSRRCEQLEKEKLEINAQSATLSQNVHNITAKYKEKLTTVKTRLDQTERERREAYTRIELLQSEIERLKDELSQKNETILEKDKVIQDTQYKHHHQILLERQSIEERISNEGKRFTELAEKTRHLEGELERCQRNQIIDRRVVIDQSIEDSSKELRVKIIELEKRSAEEMTIKDSLQVQIKILEEENIDLRTIMQQMRRRFQDNQRDDRDRNDEIQKLIARAEFHARQYMNHFNVSTFSTPSTIVRIVPLSSSNTFS